MKTIHWILIGLLFSGLFTGCYQPDPQNPGMEYAPNMYHPISYHPLREYEREPHEYNPAGRHMRKPPENTIARGQKDYVYPYPDSPEGYEQAGEELESPFSEHDEEILAEGERLYNIYCQNCHGERGLGDGSVASREPGDGLMPGIPRFSQGRVQQLPEGKIYHVIMHGRNLMGSHSSQLKPDQRWKVVQYVRKLQRYDEETDAFLPPDEVREADNNNDEDNNEETS